MKKLRVGFGNKLFEVEARELRELEMFLGLMFRTKNTRNLVFEKRGRWGIHSFFVFFDFLALWLDKNNEVIEYKIVKPFTPYVAPSREFARLVEIPLNEENREIVGLFSAKP